jgi:hypothetical protein
MHIDSYSYTCIRFNVDTCMHSRIYTHVYKQINTYMNTPTYFLLIAYKRIGEIRNVPELSEIPIMALTATAGDKVREDLRNILRLRENCHLSENSVDRPNLRISVTTQRTGGLGVNLKFLEKDIRKNVCICLYIIRIFEYLYSLIYLYTEIFICIFEYIQNICIYLCINIFFYTFIYLYLLM